MDFDKFILEDITTVENEIRNIIPKEPGAVYNMLEEYIFRAGKRIRPALLMLSFRALDGKERKNAIKSAAIIELFHNFTLIHDDIEDSSQFRRGKPTLHNSHGIPIALNSGDALYTIVWNSIIKMNMKEMAIIYSNAFRRVVEGQGIELEWYKNKKMNITEEQYFDMVSEKTGALIGAACESGALLAGANSEVAEKFRIFGEALGVAFQIQDDILNIIGDFKKYKKEIGGDISEGKRTLMVIHTFIHATEYENKKLAKILLSNTYDKKKINYVISLFKKYDSLNYAKVKAREFVEQTSMFLNELPDSKEKTELKKLAEYVINRDL